MCFYIERMWLRLIKSCYACNYTISYRNASAYSAYNTGPDPCSHSYTYTCSDSDSHTRTNTCSYRYTDPCTNPCTNSISNLYIDSYSCPFLFAGDYQEPNG